MKNDFEKMTTEEKMAIYGWSREQIPIMEDMLKKTMTDYSKPTRLNKFKRYLHQNVKIITNNDEIIFAYIDDLENSDDNDLGEEGVLFKRNDCMVEILEHEISSIEIISA